jgi:hypothetical protein
MTIGTVLVLQRRARLMIPLFSTSSVSMMSPSYLPLCSHALWLALTSATKFTATYFVYRPDVGVAKVFLLSMWNMVRLAKWNLLLGFQCWILSKFIEELYNNLTNPVQPTILFRGNEKPAWWILPKGQVIPVCCLANYNASVCWPN